VRRAVHTPCRAEHERKTPCGGLPPSPGATLPVGARAGGSDGGLAALHRCALSERGTSRTALRRTARWFASH